MLRDHQPLTRPTWYTHGLTSIDDIPYGVTMSWKLFAGSASEYGEGCTVAVFMVGDMTQQWRIIRATFSIDGVGGFDPRPGELFIPRTPDADPQWSVILNWPIMSNRPNFSGVHTLLLRAARVPRRSR